MLVGKMRYRYKMLEIRQGTEMGIGIEIKMGMRIKTGIGMEVSTEMGIRMETETKIGIQVVQIA